MQVVVYMLNVTNIYTFIVRAQARAIIIVDENEKCKIMFAIIH